MCAAVPPFETYGERLPASARRHTPYLKLKCVGLACFALVLLLPGMQALFRPFPQAHINGMAPTSGLPRPTLSGILSEKFQKSVDAWCTRGNGLWPSLVQMSNQIYYSVFGQISGSYNPSVLVGKEGIFFQPMYLRSFNRSKSFDHDAVRKAAKRLGTLEQALAKRNIPLITVISPNQIALYPERVPAAFVDPSRLSRKNSYEVMRPQLDKYGVTVLDMFQYFDQHKGDYGIDLFEPTGSHWNEVASCETTQRIVQVLGDKLKQPLPYIPCRPYTMQNPPPEPETDLVQIANLLFPERTFRPAPVINEPPVPVAGGNFKPKVLLVGSSFLFALQDRLERAHITERSPLFFYFKQRRERSRDLFQRLRTDRLDFEKDILSYDAIVLEVNQASASAVGYGFVEYALREFSRLRDRARTVAHEK